MLSCRVQSAICQDFDGIFDYRWLESNHITSHAFKRAPPTVKVAVRPIIVCALTSKARNTNNRVLRQTNWSQSSVLGYQKQAFSAQGLVSE